MGRPKPPDMQAVQRQEQKSGGAEGRDRAVAAADARAEFRELFVSLVDPAGVLDTERAGRIAAEMEEKAARAGYGKGARMARLLADTFDDVADIVNRPVEDGSINHTFTAFQKMMTLLYNNAESYRDGGNGEPVSELEELRESAASLRSKADKRRERLRAADPPGSGLDKFDSLYRGRICKEVVSKRIEKLRAEDVANGEDPIFTPIESISHIVASCEGTWSADEIIEWSRGRGAPEVYEATGAAGGADKAAGQTARPGGDNAGHPAASTCGDRSAFKEDARRGDVELTVGVSYLEERGHQSVIPKPVVDLLGIRDSITFKISNGNVAVTRGSGGEG